MNPVFDLWGGWMSGTQALYVLFALAALPFIIITTIIGKRKKK